MARLFLPGRFWLYSSAGKLLTGTCNSCNNFKSLLKNKDPGGFTLIEVLIVLLITSTLLLVAMPQLAKAVEKYSLDVAARQLAEDIRVAQQQALNEESASYFLQLYPYDPYNDWYEIKKGSASVLREERRHVPDQFFG